MTYPVAVIIPTRNEERTVEQAIRSAWNAGASEVIVTDGNSGDRTLDRARAAQALVLSSESVRGKRLNTAAARAHSRILLFLHADSTLPDNALAQVIRAIDEGCNFGGFRIRFRETHPLLRFAAGFTNLRTMITRCPRGDQAQFVRRDLFFDSGGFKEYPLMEDYEIAVRMRRYGRNVLLPLYVTTSGKRFLEHGFIRTAALNRRIILAYWMGADPAELEKLYRR